MSDLFFSCNVECPSDASTYAAQEKHTKSCFPRNCCEYKVLTQTTVPDITRYGDGTVIDTVDGDIRALYFDYRNIAVTDCVGRTEYKLKANGGDQS